MDRRTDGRHCGQGHRTHGNGAKEGPQIQGEKEYTDCGNQKRQTACTGNAPSTKVGSTPQEVTTTTKPLFSETSAAKEAQSCPSQESVEAGPFRRTRKRDYPFFDPVPLIRCVKISRPLVRRLRSQDRLTYERRKKKYVKATPPVPTFGATRYKPRTFALASKRNIFRKRGVRRIHNLVFRRVGQRLVAPRDKGRILW